MSVHHMIVAPELVDIYLFDDFDYRRCPAWKGRIQHC
jgi:hypothetical protein